MSSDTSKCVIYIECMKKLSLPLLTLLVIVFSTPGFSSEQKITPANDKVETALQAHKSEFQACYRNNGSKGSGKVMADFTIGKDGKVTAASVKNSTLNQPVVEACVLKTIQGIQFSMPQGAETVHVIYPFKFKP